MIPRHASAAAVARRPQRAVAVSSQRGSVAAALRGRAGRHNATLASSSYGWETDDHARAQAQAKSAADPRVRPVPVSAIRRPLAGSRSNDQEKVAALAASIAEHGLLEPLDVLEVDGVLYGFSGCHRYEAHVRLGKETILCRVRRATRETLMMHLR